MSTFADLFIILRSCLSYRRIRLGRTRGKSLPQSRNLRHSSSLLTLVICASVFASGCKPSYVRDQVESTTKAIASLFGLGVSVLTSSPANNPTPQVRVTGVGDGLSVSIFTNSDCNTSSLIATSPASSAASASGSSSSSGNSPGNSSGQVDITLPTLSEGSYTFYAQTKDSSGKTSSCSISSATYVYDKTPPTLSISSPAQDGYAHSLNYTAYTVSGSCSENGKTVTVFATDNTSSVNPTTQPTCDTSSTPNWSTTLNLSSLGSNIQLSATHADEAGNSATSDSITLTKDTTAPTVTTVAVQTGLTVDITFNEAMGSGVLTPSNYTVSGAGKGVLATNPASVAFVSGNKYRLSWSSGKMLNGGDLTITVANATDLAGNPISSSANSATHTGGGISSPSPAPSGLLLSTPSSTPGSITTPIIQVSGVYPGDSISIFTDSSCLVGNLKGSATVAASSSTVNVTSSALTAGPYTFYAQATDGLGNVSACSTASVAYVLDTTAPSVAITTPTASSYANLSNYNNYTISGSCSENGRVVSVAATRSGTTVNPASQPTCNTGNTPNWTTTVNLTSLSDGAVSLTATQADLAGNSTTSSAIAITKDITPPTVSTVAVQTGLTVNVTFNEAMGTGVTTAANYTLSGTGKGTLAANPTSVALVSGNTYQLSWGSGTMKKDGNITISVSTAQDLAGNTINSSGTHTSGGTATLPDAPTTLTLVTPASSPGTVTTPVIAVSGGAVANGVSVSIYTSSTCALPALKATGTSAGASINLTSLALIPDGSYTFYADLTDAAGNTSVCSTANQVYVVDTASPTLAITTPSNGGYANASNYTSYTISGSCSENTRTVTVAATDGVTTVNPGTQPTCNTGASPNWTTTVNLTTIAAGPVTLTATQSDAAGNSTNATPISITKDIIAPTVSSVAVQTGLSVNVTFSEAMGSGITTPANYTLSGTGKGTLAATPTSVALVSANTYVLTWASGIMKNGGDITIAVATATDLAGNAISSNATHTGGATAVIPATPTSLSLNSPASSPSTNTTPVILVSGGGVANGISISIYTNSGCTAPTLKGTSSAVGTSVNVTSSTLAAGAYTFYADATDAAGNISTCSTANVAYTVDTTAPTIAITSPTNGSYANASNYTSYTISGSCSENGRTVTVAATDGTLTVNPGAAPVCDTSLTPNWDTTINLTTLAAGTITLTAAQSDAAGNSTTSTAITITKDITSPTMTITTPAADGSYIYSATSSSVTVSGSCTENGSPVTVSAVNGGTVTGSPTCNTSSTPRWTTTLNLSTLNDGVINVTASQTDTAGNMTTSATRTIIKDGTGPVITLVSTNNQLYPLTATYPPIVQGSTATLSATAADAAVNGSTASSSFTCTYEVVGISSPDPQYPSGGSANCNTLPSLGTVNSTTVVTTATWNTTPGANASASLTWTPTNRQRGVYKFNLIANDGNNSTTQSVYLTVRENYTTSKLLAAMDASTGGYGASSPLTSVPAIPRTTASSNNNTTEAWQALTGATTGDLSGFSTTNPWVGSGQSSNTAVDPYALSFNGASDSFSLGTVLNTATRFATSMWVKSTSPTSTGNVISSNGGGSGNGYVLRQSTYPPGRAEFVVGKKYYSYKDLVLSDKPMAYWRLGETAGTSAADSSAYGNTATYNTTPSGGYTQNQASAIFGDADRSTYFAGGAVDSAALNLGGTFTLEAWTYLTNANASQTNVFLTNAGCGNATCSGFQLRINTWGASDQVIQLATSNGTTGATITTSGIYTYNAWHHIAVTFNRTAGTAKIYYDGTDVTPAGNTIRTDFANTNAIRIGLTGVNDQIFYGYVDDVAIYTYLLSSTQVLEHYQTGKNGNYKAYPGNAVLADNPVGYWRLNEKSGPIAYDYSGTGNNGTYTGLVTQGSSGPFTASGDQSTAPTFSSGSVNAAEPTTATTNISMEAWVYPTVASQNATIFYNGNTSTTGYGLMMNNCAGAAGSNLCVLAGGITWNVVAAPFTLSANQWTHVALTRVGTTWKTYKNGVLQSTGTTNPNALTGTGLNIGYLSGPFVGKIAEAAFYTYPLTATQIANHYNSGNGSPWWTCQSLSPISSTNWNLLSTLYDGTTAKLFVNGQQECSVTPGTTYSGAVANTKVGNHTNGSSFWQGALALFNIFGTSDGSAPASATTLKTDFDSTANRFRQKPVENIVTSGLVFHLDAANAKGGIAPYSNGCASSDLSWWDLSSTMANGILSNFASCGASTGWVGNGAVSGTYPNSGPYALAFDGTNDFGSVPLDLSGTSAITVEMWLNWTTYANNDKIALELTTNYNSNTTGFAIVPNNSAPANVASVGVYGNVGYNTSEFTRPSAGSFHHYAIVFNKSASAANEIIPYIDGTAVSYTKFVQTENTNNFGNTNLYIMSRAGTSNFASGYVSAVRVYNSALTSQQIKQNCLAQEGRFTATAQSICGAP